MAKTDFEKAFETISLVEENLAGVAIAKFEKAAAKFEKAAAGKGLVKKQVLVRRGGKTFLQNYYVSTEPHYIDGAKVSQNVKDEHVTAAADWYHKKHRALQSHMSDMSKLESHEITNQHISDLEQKVSELKMAKWSLNTKGAKHDGVIPVEDNYQMEQPNQAKDEFAPEQSTARDKKVLHSDSGKSGVVVSNSNKSNPSGMVAFLPDGASDPVWVRKDSLKEFKSDKTSKTSEPDDNEVKGAKVEAAAGEQPSQEDKDSIKLDTIYGSSSSEAGIIKILKDFYGGSVITMNKKPGDDHYTVFNSKGKIEGVAVTKKAGQRFIFGKTSKYTEGDNETHKKSQEQQTSGSAGGKKVVGHDNYNHPQYGEYNKGDEVTFEHKGEMKGGVVVRVNEYQRFPNPYVVMEGSDGKKYEIVISKVDLYKDNEDAGGASGKK